MSQIKVLLAEDHTIVRKGICSLIDGKADIQVLGEAEDGREAIERAEALAPDIVLMDITMPHLNGLEATRQIKKRCPQVKILALTMYTNEEYILQIIQAGASGYVIKQAAPAELISAIHAVYRGDMFLSPSVSKVIIDEYMKHKAPNVSAKYDELTDREREVLQLLAEGHSNRSIAKELNISIKTARVHRIRVMKKLECQSVSDLVKYAIRKGIISLN